MPAHFTVQTLELTNCFMTVRFSGGSVSALLTGDVIEFRPKINIDRIRRFLLQYFHICTIGSFF